MSWIIYKHTNKINNKTYIGQTRQKPNERWQRGKGYHRNVYFRNAIDKYGWDGFYHDILEDNIKTQDEANRLEIFYIEKYDSYYNGYNLTKGGHNGDHLGLEVVQINKKTLRPIKVFKSIRSASTETGINHSNINAVAARESVSAGGYYWAYADEYDELSWFPLENKNIIPVTMIDRVTLKPIKNFPSATIASIEMDINQSHIIAVCKKRLLSAGGYYWCYTKEYNANFKPVETKVRKVIDLNTGKVYVNSLQASKELRIQNSSIYRCLTGEIVSAGGHKFRYINSDNSIEEVLRFDKRIKHICIFETGKQFESITQAAKFFNCTKENVCRVLSNPRFTVNGCHLCYSDQMNKFKPIKKEKPRRVICIEKQQIFDSATKAANELRLDNSEICKCCKDPKRKCGGFHFKYIE